MFDPEMSPVPVRFRPLGGHTNGSSEYAYWICVLSLYTLFTKRGIGSPSLYDLIDQPSSLLATVCDMLQYAATPYRVCRRPGRAVTQRARLPSSSLCQSGSLLPLCICVWPDAAPRQPPNSARNGYASSERVVQSCVKGRTANCMCNSTQTVEESSRPRYQLFLPPAAASECTWLLRKCWPEKQLTNTCDQE